MRVRDTDFLLGGNAEERDGSYFCIPAIRVAGDEWNMAAIAIIKTMVFYIVIMCK